MSCTSEVDLPRCEFDLDDPGRTNYARDLKHLYMRFSGQLARLRMGHSPRNSPNRFGILTYHRISPVIDGFPSPYYNVPPDLFCSQLAGLQRQGFQFLGLREVLQRRMHGEMLPPLTAVVTFDDGFSSVILHALPILQSLRIPATVFVNTAYLGESSPFPFDAWGQAYAGQVRADSYLPLAIDECAELITSGLVEIGAHSHTHADFRGRPSVFRRDMEVCLETLHEKLDVACPLFAFPYGCPRLGHAGDDLVEVVRQLGLPTALTTVAECIELSDSPLRWGRFTAYDWDSADTLAAKLTGNYSWALHAAERISRLWQVRLRSNRGLTVDKEIPAHA